MNYYVVDVWKYNFYEMLFYWLEYYIIDFTIQKKNADHEATKVERFIVPPVTIKKKNTPNNAKYVFFNSTWKNSEK